MFGSGALAELCRLFDVFWTLGCYLLPSLLPASTLESNLGLVRIH